MTLQEHLFPATAMPDKDWWHTLWPDPDGVVSALRMERGMKVIDLGCGDGYFTAAIARHVGPGRVLGLDLDPVMLEQAQAACAGMTNCDWLLGDAMALSRLQGAPADYVSIVNTFHGGAAPRSRCGLEAQRPLRHRQLALPAARASDRSWPAVRPPDRNAHGAGANPRGSRAVRLQTGNGHGNRTQE